MGDRREPRTNTDQKSDKLKRVDSIKESSLSFSGRLQEIRKSRGLTQEEAANGLKIKLNTYRKLEQGVNRSDSADFIRTLADFYNVSADYLLGRELTESLNYETVTAKTGLNVRSIQQITELYSQDGADPSPGYMDFLNCFLGNGECTGLFFQSLMPLLDKIYMYKHTDSRSERLVNITSTEMADLIYDYLNKVVIPTYGQLRETGEYKSPSPKDYLTE